MSGTIVFIDTSVLCNLLRVHGKDQRSDEIAREMGKRVREGQVFVLPVTAVIETGNHIAQASGYRYEAASRLADYLRLIVQQKAPWVLHEMEWDIPFLHRFLEGAGSGSDWPALAARGVGAGDLCIAAEVQRYRDRVGDHVSVWSLDDDLHQLVP